MKVILNLAIGIFVSGFILKFFHIHYNAILMMVGVLIMLVLYTINSLKRVSDINSLLGFAFTSWLIVLLFVVKYFLFLNVVLAIACIMTVVAFGLTYKKQLIRQKAMLLLALVVAVSFASTPTDTRYYILSLKWNQEIESDFISWDKYSWHLYNNLKYDEALRASNTAKHLVDLHASAKWAPIIAEHNRKIREKKWNRY